MVVAAAKNGPSGPEIRLESTRGEPGRRSPARRGSGGTMDHPIKPLGGGSIKNRQGRVSRRVRMDSPGSRPARGTGGAAGGQTGTI